MKYKPLLLSRLPFLWLALLAVASLSLPCCQGVKERQATIAAAQDSLVNSQERFGDYVFQLLNPEEAVAALTTDTVQGYFELLTKAELARQLGIKDTTAGYEGLMTRYLKVLGASAVSLSEEDKARLLLATQEALRRIAPFSLPLPPLFLIATNGRPFGESVFYTRQAAIFCPPVWRSLSPEGLVNVILHEIFHVFSRYNPLKRAALYRLLGFEPVSAVQLPEDLYQSLLLNPDGLQEPNNRWAITLIDSLGKEYLALPLIVSRSPLSATMPYMARLELRLFRLRPHAGGYEASSLDYLLPHQAKGWEEQIGTNTNYVIHPDEILADNFVLLCNRNKGLALPESLPASGIALLDSISKVLQDE